MIAFIKEHESALVSIVGILFIAIIFMSFYYWLDSNTEHKITCYRNNDIELEISGKIKGLKKENYIVIKDNKRNAYKIIIANYDFCEWHLL